MLCIFVKKCFDPSFIAMATHIYHLFFLSLFQEARSTVIARNLEITEVERGIGNSIKAVENEIKKTLGSIDNVASDEANLEAKIEKKKGELERNQKRLVTLQSVRYLAFKVSKIYIICINIILSLNLYSCIHFNVVFNVFLLQLNPSFTPFKVVR